eukprot:5972559-Pleurochrysis_carterae.AAC.1
MSRRARRSASMIEYLRCIQEHLHLGQTLMQSGHTAVRAALVLPPHASLRWRCMQVFSLRGWRRFRQCAYVDA